MEQMSDSLFMPHPKCSTLHEPVFPHRAAPSGAEVLDGRSLAAYDTSTTEGSLPEFDLDGARRGSDVATCDSLPEIELPARVVSGQDAAFEPFDAVEEGSNEDESSAEPRVLSSCSDVSVGLPATAVCEVSWGRVAANEFGFEVGQVLKLGEFGGVRLVQDVRSGTIAAAKFTVSTGAADNRPLGRREYELLRSLRHDHIIDSWFFMETRFETFMFMDFCASGSLWTHVSSRRDGLQLTEVHRLGLQLIDAVDHVHSAGIVHCAVQPANVLVAFGGDLRLSGFGSCRWKASNSSIICPETSQEDLVRAVAGDFQVAPELAGPYMATTQTDVWGLGFCALCMLSGDSTPEGTSAGSVSLASGFCRRWDTAAARRFFDTHPCASELGSRSFFRNVAKSLHQNPMLRPSLAEMDHSQAVL